STSVMGSGGQCAVGNSHRSSAELFESPVAKSVTSCPLATNPSASSATTSSVPPYWGGGVGTNGVETIAIRMAVLFLARPREPGERTGPVRGRPGVQRRDRPPGGRPDRGPGTVGVPAGSHAPVVPDPAAILAGRSPVQAAPLCQARQPAVPWRGAACGYGPPPPSARGWGG